MFSRLINEDRVKDIHNGKPFVIINSNFPEVDWQEVLNLLNDDIVNQKPHGGALFKDYGFRLINAQRIDYVNSLVEELYTVFEKSPDFSDQGIEEHAHQIYISLTTQSGSYGGKHHEPEHVIFWQLQGSSTWKIYKTEDELDIVQTLNKGDILYCPPSRWHEVIAESPRCGISMGFGKIKNV